MENSWDLAALESRGYVSKKTNAVYDNEFNRALSQVPWSAWIQSDQRFRCRGEYLEAYAARLNASSLNRIDGLSTFHVRHLINGTTQTFDEAYHKHAKRRLRMFKGEYAYHRRCVPESVFLEDAPLSQNDYVIVSAPFCSTGDVHPGFYPLLNEAAKLGVPVIVDGAYFGTCHDVYLNVDHPAIESVSFSLTKGAGLGDIRSGIRFSRSEDSLPIAQQNKYDHTVLAAARIGLYMMERFDLDFIPRKYLQIQRDVCARVPGLTPTKCMHLALGDERFDSYKIDSVYNRVGIRELIRAKAKGHLA